jgi:RND family efflux transporter MFP subunit
MAGVVSICERGKGMKAATIDAPATQRTVETPVAQPDVGAATAIPADSVLAPKPPDDAPAAKRPATKSPVEAPADEPARQVWHPPRKPVRTIVLIVLLAAGTMLAVLKAWDLPPFVGGNERTDNAYVHGLTMGVAPQVSGYVVAVEIRDFEQVRVGQVLVRVDDRMYKARVAAARANLSAQIAGLANARAQLMRAQADMARVNDLVSDGSVSIRERDQTLAALRQAEAQVRQENGGEGSFEAQVDAARAQLELAQIDLEHTVISAAADGQMSEIGVRVGQYVTSGTQLMSLVPADRWVIADFKEGQVAKIMPGQRATFTVDALNDAQFTGRVERLAPAAGSEFAVLKPDNATGNFVKVPQRIGVRIAIDPGQRLASRLAPGMSVEAVVDTKAGKQ